MDDPLAESTLAAVSSDADADLPAVVWVHADSPFTDEVGVPYPNQLVDGTGKVHGPWFGRRVHSLTRGFDEARLLEILVLRAAPAAELGR
jgi:hypothetical protein